LEHFAIPGVYLMLVRGLLFVGFLVHLFFASLFAGLALHLMASSVIPA
jgi:hypothetical protein